MSIRRDTRSPLAYVHILPLPVRLLVRGIPPFLIHLLYCCRAAACATARDVNLLFLFDPLLWCVCALGSSRSLLLLFTAFGRRYGAGYLVTNGLHFACTVLFDDPASVTLSLCSMFRVSWTLKATFVRLLPIRLLFLAFFPVSFLCVRIYL
jgi:hypothetical protein